MKQDIPLREYAQQFGQAFVAEQLGYSRAAISVMLSKDKKIYIRPAANGRITAYEIRPIGKFRASNA